MDLNYIFRFYLWHSQSFLGWVGDYSEGQNKEEIEKCLVQMRKIEEKWGKWKSCPPRTLRLAMALAFIFFWSANRQLSFSRICQFEVKIKYDISECAALHRIILWNALPFFRFFLYIQILPTGYVGLVLCSGYAVPLRVLCVYFAANTCAVAS